MRSIFIGFLIVLSQGTLFAQSTNEGSPDLPGDLMVNVGLNFLQDQSPEMDLSLFGSKSLGLYYSNRFEISPAISFYPAIGLGLEKYSFDNDVAIVRDADDVVVLNDISSLGDIKRTKLAVTYLEIPAEFRFFPKKTSDGSGFFIGIGGSLGLRIESHSKVRIEDAQGDLTQNKNREDFDLNTFRYGLIGRVGARGINAFYRIYLSDLFDKDKGPGGAVPTSFTVGLGINAF